MDTADRDTARQILDITKSLNNLEPTEEGAADLIAHTAEALKSQIAESIKRLSDDANKIIRKRAPFLDDLDSIFTSMKSGELIEFLQVCHEVEAMLSGEERVVTHLEIIGQIRKNVLRLRDIYWLRKKYNSNWTMLNAVFSDCWHTEASLAKYVALNTNTYKVWALLPEFSVFGIRNKDDESIHWKLVIATDLDYPFKVSLIQFLEENDVFTKKGKQFKFEDYVRVIDFLKSESSCPYPGSPTFYRWI